MENNIYYNGLSSLFVRVNNNHNDKIWDEILKALKKIEPEKSNEELFRQIIECFETLLSESTNDKMSLFFLSFLINITDNVEYFERLLQLCLDSGSIPVNTKFYVYNYCRKLIFDKFYFRKENCLVLMNQIFDLCYKMNEKYFSYSINNLSLDNNGDVAVLIVSDLGEYPFGSIKHVLDVCNMLIEKKSKICVMITHEESFEYGKINLHPLSSYGLDTCENTSSSVSLISELSNNIEIHEFDNKNSFINEAKKAILKINGMNLQLIINFSEKNMFTELISLKLNVNDLKKININQNIETNKIINGILFEAQKYVDADRFNKAALRLFKAYKLIKNNNEKVKIGVQLMSCYFNVNENEKALKLAKGLLILDDSTELINILSYVYEGIKDSKNAIFFREKIMQVDNDNYPNNLKLFKLYLDEMMYEKAVMINERLRDKIDAEIEGLRFRLFYKSFEEKEAFMHMETAINLLKDSSIAGYAENLLASITASLYYDIYDDNEYIQKNSELYRVITPLNEKIINNYKPNSKLIRIGFITGELAYHPVGYFISSLFKTEYKSDKFLYYFYNSVKKDGEDTITKLIKKKSDVYRFIGDLSDIEASEVISGDRIDILIDLNGISETQKINMLVNRLAPIQITWIGFPCSMPIKNIDYNIVDKITDPIGISEKFYTEKLVYLPKTFLCYGNVINEKIEEPPYKKRGYITFGSFNNASKYSDYILGIWGKLFNKLKDARLIIRTKEVGKKYTRDKLINKFIKNGIDVNRVDFLPTTDRQHYNLQYNEVDIVLDTYPFNGATTTCDAFLMGTPIISLYGQRHVSRVGLSMLSNIGLTDLAVANGEDYIAKALELSHDRNRLEFLSKNLRNIMLASPLMNYEEFKKDFEEAIYDVYHKEGVF